MMINVLLDGSKDDDDDEDEEINSADASSLLVRLAAAVS